MDWTDLNKHGLRLNRIIRILEKRLKKSDDDDKIIRYSNSITIMTRELVSIAKLHLGIKDTLEEVENLR